MRQAFTQFADTFGAPVMRMTRGSQGKMKWRDHDVARRWYLKGLGVLDF